MSTLCHDFSNGVNFGVSEDVLFNLGVQINQFNLFHNRSIHLRSKGNIQAWWEEFLGPYNTGPFGCLAQQLGMRIPNTSELDDYGCISIFNEAAKAFNSKLNDICQHLRLQMEHATIVYVDLYSIKHSLYANSSSYGFEKPLMACCGHGGPPYNYDVEVACLMGGFDLCEKESRYISWDGIHYTEAANEIVASEILSKKYSTPPLEFNFFCDNSRMLEMCND